jgi:hypothetical protein
MNLVNILAPIIGAAVLERYPNLHIVFGESRLLAPAVQGDAPVRPRR